MPQRHIEEVQYIKLDFLKNLVGKYPMLAFESLPAKILFTGTARAALRIILEYLTEISLLKNKNDEVLIPPWLCQSILHTMHRFCFPTLTIGKNLKGIMAYHQYGFPQKMDEICTFSREHNLFLIEDCANVYESYYQGKPVGTFGIGAIFSFPKLFPSLLGGALATTNDELFEFGRRRLRNSSSFLSYLTYGSRIIWECSKDTFLNGAVCKLQEMVYGVTDYALNIKDISLRIVSRQLANGAMQRRKENYHFVLKYFEDRPAYFDNLEREGVIPYIVPLFDKVNNLEKMVKNLNERNVVTGIYHFDKNRNLLKPNFEKCLWVPVHQGLNRTDMEMICETIKRACN